MADPRIEPNEELARQEKNRAEEQAAIAKQEKQVEAMDQRVEEEEKNFEAKMAEFEKAVNEGHPATPEEKNAISRLKKKLEGVQLLRKAMRDELRRLQAAANVEISTEEPEEIVETSDILEEEPDFDIDVEEPEPNFDIDVDEAAAGMSPEQKVAEGAAVQELKELPPEKKLWVYKGLKNLGFTLNTLKSEGLSRALDWAKGKAEKGGTMSRFLEAASENYGKEAERSRKMMDQTGKLKHVGNLGAAASWARVGWDLVGKGASTLNPLRNITAAAMALGRGAEIGKEARLKNVEVKEKTRVADVDAAAEEAWNVYEKAGISSERPVSREELQKAYMGTVPEDIMKRINKGAEAGVSQVMQKILQKDLGWAVARIDKELKWIDADVTLDEKTKELKKSKLIASHEQFLADMDRIVGQAGTVDALAYSARLAEKGAKATQLLMIGESVMQLAGRSFLAFQDHIGDVRAEELGSALREKYRLMHEAAAVKTASAEIMNKIPDGHQTPVEGIKSFEVETTIKKGEGYSQAFARVLKGNPEKFGYDPKVHGADVNAWAEQEATTKVKDLGLWSTHEDYQANIGDKIKVAGLPSLDSHDKHYNTLVIMDEGYVKMRNMPPPPEGWGSIDLKTDHKFAEGTVGHFTYDGNDVASFESPISKEELQRAQDLLVSDEGLMKEATMSAADRKLLDAELATIYKDQEVLAALVKDGRGASAEANMLRGVIHGAEADIKNNWGSEFLSTEHHERQQIADASMIGMKDFEAGDKVKGTFVYNASGQCAGFKPGMLTRVDAVKALIDPERQGEFMGSNSKALLVTRIWEEQKVLDKLTADGKGDSSEARWLKMELNGYKRYLMQIGGEKMLSDKGLKMVAGIETAEPLKKAVDEAMKGSDAVRKNTEEQLKGAKPLEEPKKMEYRGEKPAEETVSRKLPRKPSDEVVNPFEEEKAPKTKYTKEVTEKLNERGEKVTETKQELSLEGEAGPIITTHYIKDGVPWIPKVAEIQGMKDIGMAQEMFSAELRTTVMHRRALEALEKAGKGSSEEALMHKERIDEFNKTYNEVLEKPI